MRRNNLLRKGITMNTATWKIEDLKFGVELECGGIDRLLAAQAVASVVDGTIQPGVGYHTYRVIAQDGRTWSVVSDSSLTEYADNERIEVVSPILTWSDLPVYQEIVRALRRAGCKVNGQAGLHVHVGAEHFDGKHLAILAKQVYSNEDLIFNAFAVSESRKARYTKPLDETFITRLRKRKPTSRDDFFTCWYGERNYTPSRYDSSRYHIVNFNSTAVRDTIEFRSYTPEGLHAGKIKAAIVFSLALCARALNCSNAAAKKKAYDPASAKYDFRVALILALGLIGDEHKNTRKHLLARMPGDAAYKHGAQRKARLTAKAEEGAAVCAD